ncbi:MAG TPA: hypothetical protein VIG97_07910 [Luteimonas sp.]
MPRNHTAIPVPATALLLALALAPASSEAGPRHPGYIEASSYLQSDADYEAWFTLRRQLARNFDDICGDTFCEGEYTNIQSMRYVCSVQRLTGRIGQCGWSFVASEESVDRLRGTISADAPAWLCPSPLVPGTRFEELLDALEGDEPLYAALPGTERTLYDGLVDCL